MRLRATDRESLARAFGSRLSETRIFVPTKEKIPLGRPLVVELFYSHGELAVRGSGHVATLHALTRPGILALVEWAEESKPLIQWVVEESRRARKRGSRSRARLSVAGFARDASPSVEERLPQAVKVLEEEGAAPPTSEREDARVEIRPMLGERTDEAPPQSFGPALDAESGSGLGAEEWAPLEAPPSEEAVHAPSPAPLITREEAVPASPDVALGAPRAALALPEVAADEPVEALTSRDLSLLPPEQAFKDPPIPEPRTLEVPTPWAASSSVEASLRAAILEPPLLEIVPDVSLVTVPESFAPLDAFSEAPSPGEPTRESVIAEEEIAARAPVAASTPTEARVDRRREAGAPGEALPAKGVAEAPSAPKGRGFFGWLRRLFGGDG